MGAFRIGFCGVFLKFPGSTVPSVQGWGGGMAAGGGEGEGLMTSMRMRLTSTVSLSALCIGGEGEDGGMLMMLMLFCMMLIAYAEDNNGDDDTYGDINDNPHCCCCCCCSCCCSCCGRRWCLKNEQPMYKTLRTLNTKTYRTPNKIKLPRRISRRSSEHFLVAGGFLADGYRIKVS